MRILTSLAVCVLAAAVTLPARSIAGGGLQDKPANVAGTWAITVETANGTGTPKLALEQDGGTLAGTYSSEVFGEQKVTGTVKGTAITFGFTGEVQGTSVKVTYTGTVENGTMKGKVTLGDLGEGTFTGKKQ
jgi:hypothetical protein